MAERRDAGFRPLRPLPQNRNHLMSQVDQLPSPFPSDPELIAMCDNISTMFSVCLGGLDAAPSASSWLKSPRIVVPLDVSGGFEGVARKILGSQVTSPAVVSAVARMVQKHSAFTDSDSPDFVRIRDVADVLAWYVLDSSAAGDDSIAGAVDDDAVDLIALCDGQAAKLGMSKTVMDLNHTVSVGRQPSRFYDRVHEDNDVHRVARLILNSQLTSPAAVSAVARMTQALVPFDPIESPDFARIRDATDALVWWVVGRVAPGVDRS